MVEVLGANQMMKGRKIAGSADSGAGVGLTGFYVANGELQERLRSLDETEGPFSDVALFESEGWTAFIAVIGPRYEGGPLKVGHFRRESHRFFEELPAWFFKTKAVSIERITIIQASGFLTLLFLYAGQEPHA